MERTVIQHRFPSLSGRIFIPWIKTKEKLFIDKTHETLVDISMNHYKIALSFYVHCLVGLINSSQDFRKTLYLIFLLVFPSPLNEWEYYQINLFSLEKRTHVDQVFWCNWDDSLLTYTMKSTAIFSIWTLVDPALYLI